ncbi:MAG: hypothetical protein AAFS10_15555, partial [Myxococcota bacterium]
MSLWWALGAALVLLSAACSDGGGSTIQNTGCRATADCSDGLICACEQCVEPAQAQSACGLMIDAGSGQGDAGDGGNVSGCMSDQACGQGRFCDMETGDCLDRVCEADDDCLGEARCERFQCVPIGERLCTPNAVTCYDDAEETLLVCNADGSELSLDPCPAGARCV